MRLKRIEKIEEYIKDKKTVSINELCDVFGVSKNTIRRDISELVKKGSVNKTYGGVSAVSHRGLDSFQERDTKNLSAKKLIGHNASKLVNDGDIIFIDSGTTTKHMFENLKDRQNLTILTNNLDIIVNAIPYENLKVISLSGKLDSKTLSFTGQVAADILKNYNINKAFMASTGISIRNGVTNASPEEYAIKQVAIERCEQVILLIDHTKFDVAALLSYCTLDKINILITDESPPESYYDFFAAHGNIIRIAE